MIYKKEMELAPISFFVYNRPEHTKKSIETLKNNTLTKLSHLIIFSDGPKTTEDKQKVEAVRAYIKSISGFKSVEILKSEKKLGLANSIIKGTTKVINKYGKVIVLEDDLITSKYFLRFINDALDFYKDNKKIFSVTGYSYPKNIMIIPKDYNKDMYFCPRCSSWGWATWKDRGDKVDWEVKDYQDFLNNRRLQKLYNYTGDDKTEMLIAQKEGKIDSWAIRWDYAHFRNNTYCVYPVESFIDNIGFDGSGRHCDYYAGYSHQGNIENQTYNIKFVSKVELDKKIMAEFRKIFRRGISFKIKNIIKKLIFYDKWKPKDKKPPA